MFGALLILWLAQLLPQFIANKNPVFFLDLPGMRAVIRLCLVLQERDPDWRQHYRLFADNARYHKSEYLMGKLRAFQIPTLFSGKHP